MRSARAKLNFNEQLIKCDPPVLNRTNRNQASTPVTNHNEISGEYSGRFINVVPPSVESEA